MNDTTNALRCVRCKSVVMSDETWRMGPGGPEHRCSDVHPQAGHMTPHLEPVDGVAPQDVYELAVMDSIRSTNLKRLLDESDEKHQRSYTALFERASADVDAILAVLPEAISNLLIQIVPLYEFEGGQMGWMVKGKHVDAELFVRALYAGMFTEVADGFANYYAPHLLALVDPVSRVRNVWWRVGIAEGGDPEGPRCWYDAEPNSPGAFMATVLEW